MKRHFGLAAPAFLADSTAPRRWQEVTGARCRITCGNFHRVEPVTPAPAGVPTGPDEAALVADCASRGLQGRAAVPPVNGWTNPGVPSRTNRSLWGRGWW